MPDSTQRNHAFLGKIKQISKTKKLAPRKKIALELLHQGLGQRSTRSLMDGDNANIWEDIEPIIDPDPFFTSCHIYSMNKKARSKNPLNPKAHFKWVFIDIIPATAPIVLTSDTTLSDYLLIFDAYSILLKLYGTEKITTEEVMNELDMFQSRFGMIDEFGWRDLEIFSADSGSQFTSTKFKEECQTH